ncbi:MAG: hypothetical protein GXP63_02010, partial [DPANN group archaeon]|nr:hypothetical protein [DPANN group archaeon]
MKSDRRQERVLFIGEFDYDTYTRGRILHKGLLRQKVPVKLFLRRGPFRYFQIMLRVLRNDYDVLLVNGKIVLLVSRLFTWKPILFDMATSDYDTLVRNRK